MNWCVKAWNRFPSSCKLSDFFFCIDFIRFFMNLYIQIYINGIYTYACIYLCCGQFCFFFSLDSTVYHFFLVYNIHLDDVCSSHFWLYEICLCIEQFDQFQWHFCVNVFYFVTIIRCKRIHSNYYLYNIRHTEKPMRKRRKKNTAKKCSFWGLCTTLGGWKNDKYTHTQSDKSRTVKKTSILYLWSKWNEVRTNSIQSYNSIH